MQTSQSAQSPGDNAPKQVSFADGGSWANTLLGCCFVLASCLRHLKRKMYDLTDESLYWKQSTILENVEALKLWTRIRKH